MTILRSASGTRIECDQCGEHVASASLTIDQLRREAGFVNDTERDWCPTCWESPADEAPSPR